jgi:hypothetical protein
MKGRFGWNFANSAGIMRSRTEDTEGTEDFWGAEVVLCGSYFEGAGSY